MSRVLYKRIAPQLDRVRADGGTPTDKINDLILLRQFHEELKDNIAFSWMADIGGIKERISGVGRFITKAYDFSGNNNDAAQATALNQPYRFFDGGMKNVNGGAANMTHTAISFAANESWSVTFVVNWFGSSYLSNPISGDAISSGSALWVRRSGSNRFGVHNGTTEFLGTIGNSNRIRGRNIPITFIANGTSLLVYVSGVLLETIAMPTTIMTFRQILAGRLAAPEFHQGDVKYYQIYRTALTPAQITAEHALLSTLYPEIPSVTIGSQTFTKYNAEMVATPVGNVIQEMQAATATEIITNAADREFTSDTGYWTRENASITISGGTLNYLATSQIFTTFRNIGAVVGRIYRIEYTITEITAGGFLVNIGVTSGGIVRNAPGTYVEYIIATTSTIAVRCSGTTTGKIDNISVKLAVWQDSTGIYDAIYAQTGGTVAQKTTAALRVAAMWRYPNNDSAIGSWAGKLFNKFAFKLMHEDILAFNAANPTTPWGYAVPTRAQLTTLAAIGGNAAKVTGTDYWTIANGTNTSGLSLLGTGFIQADGTYTDNKASTLLMCHDADFARKVVDGDNTFDEVAITTEGGSLRLIKV